MAAPAAAATKVFIGGLSWATDDAKLRSYFENFGSVVEAFVSYDKYTGRPRGFGFVVFESPEVVKKVIESKHTIDKRDVECKIAVPKEEVPTPAAGADASTKTRKIFVGGLAPTVDDQVLRQYFEQFGAVEDAVVMYDHDNKRPRGFGFITFAEDESVDKVFASGAMQNIHDKQIEIKPAVPRDQMPPQARRGPPFFPVGRGGPGMGPAGMAGFAAGRAPPFGFRQPLPAQGAFGPGPRTPGSMTPYLQATPSPRNLGANLGPGYGGSPHARGAAGAYGAGMQAPLQYGGQQQQQQQRFSAAGMGGGGRFAAAGVGQQQFGTGVYGSLGFGGGDAGLMQPGTSPGGMGMYNIGGGLQQLQPTAQQLQQQQGGINGYPGQLDMSKLAPLAASAGPQGAAAAAAAAMAAKAQYGVQPGLGAGGFPGFAAGGQQDFGQAQQGYGAGDPAAAAAAAAAAGYGPEAVAHMGTSPLGTAPEFTTFGAGAAGPWGS